MPLKTTHHFVSYLLKLAYRFRVMATRRWRLQLFAALKKNKQIISNRPWQDAVVALLLMALLLFASPLVNWWADTGKSWYFPFLLWGLIIAAAFLIQRLHRHDL